MDFESIVEGKFWQEFEGHRIKVTSPELFLSDAFDSLACSSDFLNKLAMLLLWIVLQRHVAINRMHLSCLIAIILLSEWIQDRFQVHVGHIDKVIV